MTTILIDGIERPSVNSLGIPLHPTEAGVANFWRWFDQSKITDGWEGEGEPLRLYHITRGDFDAFRVGADARDPLGGGSGPVIYMTNDPEDQRAAHNVGGFGGQFKEGTHVMPLYAAIRQPLYIDAVNRNAVVQELGLGRGVPFIWTRADVDALMAAGYDGVVLFQDEAPTEVMAFRPEQVKSALANSGAFEPASPDLCCRSEGRALARNATHDQGSARRRIDEDFEP